MILWWIFFGVFILAMLTLDLVVFSRRAHAVKIKESLYWTSFWIVLALLFCAGIYSFYGHQKALEFLTGYLIEYSLSIDNLFVFLLFFRYFSVPVEYEQKALIWGIIIALITRGIFIFAGIALINNFHWVIYIFGAFLIFTAIQIARGKEQEVHPEKNIALKLLRTFIPVSHEYSGHKFVTIIKRKRYATPLLVVILVLGTTDVFFAVDSCGCSGHNRSIYRLYFQRLCRFRPAFSFLCYFRFDETLSPSAIWPGGDFGFCGN